MRVLSLGAGVQSSTLALMCAAGEIEAPEIAIFADTQDEPDTQPCGCVVTEGYGHTHTKMCPAHKYEAFKDKREKVAPDNLDLIGE